MARARIERCVICDRHVDQCGPLSARKRCEDCGAAQVDRAARQMIAKDGPAYDRWRDNMAAYGRSLVERFGED